MNRVFFLIAIGLAGTGCGRSDVTIRTYQEVTEFAPSPAGPHSHRAPASAPDTAWTCPEGWTEMPASGMRLVTFVVGDNECTILRFPGSVGGLRANLERWAGQLNTTLPSTELLDAFLEQAPSFQTEGGFEGHVYDFRRLLPDTDPSMLVAVVSQPDGLLFVKLQAAKDVLDQEKERFAALARSLR